MTLRFINVKLLLMGEKILIVDDDADLRSELKDALVDYEVVEASGAQEAFKLLRRANEIGLVILDVMMPGVNGLDALVEIKRTDPSLAVIILTGHSSKDVAIEALKSRADDYIEKPAQVDKIQSAIEKLIGKRRGLAPVSSLDLKEKVERVKDFLLRNRQKKVTLKEAAESVYLSPKYLSRVFKEYAKVGFSGYKLSLKFGLAKELLQKTGYNINQISDQLGYENVESFTRQFKKFSGKTPKIYRRKVKTQKRIKAKRS